jgi:hypothetical protein
VIRSNWRRTGRAGLAQVEECIRSFAYAQDKLSENEKFGFADQSMAEVTASNNKQNKYAMGSISNREYA